MSQRYSATNQQHMLNQSIYSDYQQTASNAIYADDGRRATSQHQQLPPPLLDFSFKNQNIHPHYYQQQQPQQYNQVNFRPPNEATFTIQENSRGYRPNNFISSKNQDQNYPKHAQYDPMNYHNMNNNSSSSLGK